MANIFFFGIHPLTGLHIILHIMPKYKIHAEKQSLIILAQMKI